MGTFACVLERQTHAFFIKTELVNLFIFCENIYCVGAIFSIACVHSKQSWYKDIIVDFLLNRTNSLLVLLHLLRTRNQTDWDKICYITF